MTEQTLSSGSDSGKLNKEYKLSVIVAIIAALGGLGIIIWSLDFVISAVQSPFFNGSQLMIPILVIIMVVIMMAVAILDMKKKKQRLESKLESPTEQKDGLQ